VPNNYLRRAQEIAARQDRYITSVTSGFQERLARIVTQAQGRMIVTLTERLRLDTDGVVELTAANQNTLRSLSGLFQEYMNDAGHQDLVTAYVGQFDGTLPFFQETLNALSETMRAPLPEVGFSARDTRAFSSMRIGAATNLDSVIEAAGNNAMRQALFSVGGIPFRDLVDVISEQFGRSIQESSGIGSTAMSTYYRTVANRGFEIIEADLPEMKIRYTYVGPLDNLTRPFCRRMVAAARGGRSWTRDEISAMNNGTSLSNVMVHGGGWNCRHQLVLATDLIGRPSAAPAAASNLATAVRKAERGLKKIPK